METTDNEYWQRLKAIINITGMTTHAFALYIGLPYGENLYRIKHGKNGISRRLADRIIDKYPEISKGWLLSGEGSMLKNISEQE